MKRNTRIALAASSALALALPAFAGTIAHEDRMEMAAVAHAAITPTRAVKIAENGGGRAYGYGMEATHHGDWYEVDVLRGGAKLDLRIDPTTGKVLGSSAAQGEDAHGAHALDGSKLTFGEAIAQAERVGHGPALEASAAGHGAKAHVDVDIIQNHGQRIAHYRISMHDAKIQSVMTGTDS
ncbi:MAG TPA: PepSY domain-containing protein [Rhodanobacteraceae bacterium]|nr:PepSY domain-containing protein [Rhodanobacteraceae bacterium]